MANGEQRRDFVYVGDGWSQFSDFFDKIAGVIELFGLHKRPTIEKVHAFIKASGHTLKGKHHEIYLSDIRKAAPEKWKTVSRMHRPYRP